MIRRRRNPIRVLGIVLGILVAIVAVAVAAAVLLIDPNSLKPRIIAEVQRATGREIAIAGRISLEPTFPPTLSAEQVSIANVPGGSRPQMATVRRVEAQIDLLALFSRHVVIQRLVLLQPDLLLETDSQGVPNWRLARPATPATPGAVTAATTSPGTSPLAPRLVELPRTSVQTVHIRDGVITWRGAHPLRLDLAKLDATATSIDSPVSVVGEGKLDGAGFALTAQTGPLTRLLDRASTAAWPLQATLSSGTGSEGQLLAGISARLTVAGTLTNPAEGSGYALTINGTAPDLGALGGAGLPHLKAVTIAGRITDSGGSVPDFTQVKLHAGASDLSDLVPGLVLDQTDISLPGPTEPMHGEMHGTLAGTPLDLVATLGAPRALLQGRTMPAGVKFPVDIALDLAGLKLTAKGGIASPATLTGLDVAVQADLADLRTLTPLIGRRMPVLRDVAFKGRVADGPGGYTRAVVLTGVSLTSPQGDLSGDATVLLGDKPKLEATLLSKLIDVDALLALLPGADPAPPAPATPAAAPATSAPAPAPAPASTPATPAAAPESKPFMDRTWPADGLKRANADLSVTFGEVRSQGTVYRDVAGHAVVQNGKLTLDPFGGQTPSGRLEGSLSLDASQPEPPVTLSLRAPGLQAKPVLALLGLPDDVTGAIEVNAELKGAGQTPRAALAGVDGRLGLAIVDGDLDNRVIAAIVGDVLRAAKLPADLGGAGRTKLRCFALRLDATHGAAAIGALVLDSTRLLLQGSGSVNLGDDGLALRLRPILRLGAGPGVAVPVRVGGTMREPKFTVDVGGALEATLGAAAGVQGGRGVSPSGADRNGDLCSPALAAARMGNAGAVPATPPGAAPPERVPPAAALLRSLTR